jgi:hypothetical protein
LLLDVQQTSSRDGRIKETLGLVKWIKPFTDEDSYLIEKNSIVINVSASDGLSKYYEYILKKLDEPKMTKVEEIPIPEEDDLEKLDDSEIEQLMQEIKSRTVH